MTGCCSPSRDEGEPSQADAPAPIAGGVRRDGDPTLGLARLVGGVFLVGSDDADHPEEWPVREARIEAFWIARCAVTNAEFAAFVTATGYRSEAQRWGWSFVFAALLPDDFEPTAGVAAAPWWRQVYGADWAHPEGPQSDVLTRAEHPVVHVSRNDAAAYAAWWGGRLPTEHEWEVAARGGLVGAPFPWGEELEPGGEHRMNVWQGTFPSHNTRADGWLGTCPVDAFTANDHGLFNTTGNVWEWCAGAWTEADEFGRQVGVSRGGSYLCHASYCRRYRVSARQSHAADSTTGNLGFRIAVG